MALTISNYFSSLIAFNLFIQFLCYHCGLLKSHLFCYLKSFSSVYPNWIDHFKFKCHHLFHLLNQYFYYFMNSFIVLRYCFPNYFLFISFFIWIYMNWNFWCSYSTINFKYNLIYLEFFFSFQVKFTDLLFSFFLEQLFVVPLDISTSFALITSQSI